VNGFSIHRSLITIHDSKMRLNRFLAAAGVASRRGADELIATGQVTVNGKTCSDFHYQPATTDHVKVNGKAVQVRANVYLALNKPAGFVCTRRDPHATDTIFHLLPLKFSALTYVGRLDASSEGLLLLTNDGDFVQRLTHPRFKTEKEYEVTLDRPATPELAQQLLRGVVLDGKRARAIRVRQIGPAKFRIILEQGINRQIRRMLEQFGFRVKRLVRIRIGNLGLGDLPRGHWRALTRGELSNAAMEGRAPRGRRRGSSAPQS
jgi:23S rRNA pseudouridine2605 synthase